MKKLSLATAVLLLIVANHSAQTSPRPAPTIVKGDDRPRLVQTAKPFYTDEAASAGNERIYVRSGSGVKIPLTDGASMVIGLPSGLNTSGMNSVPMSRNLPLRSPVLTRFAQVIAPRDILVEARIVGRGAGLKDRAEIAIEPQVFLVDVETFVLLGERDGLRVFMKPGKWAIKVQCSILAIENPEGPSWYAKTSHEGTVKGERFGFERKTGSGEDRFSGLPYFNPYGSVLYGISQTRSLIKAIFQRPNIRLAERTEIYYRIDHMEATFLSDPIPRGVMNVVYQ